EVILEAKTTRNAQGGGTIRKRSDGRWEARYTIGIDPGTGKQIQKSVYGQTQKEVRQRLSKATTELDEGAYFEPTRMTVGQWLDLWMDTYVSHSVKPFTVDSYRTKCEKHIKPALGMTKLAALTAPQIQQFYNDLYTATGLSGKTIKDIHGVFHRALSQAVKTGMLRYNPTEACDLPKVETKEIVPLEQEQITALLQELRGHKFEYLYCVTLFTGVRQGEILGLTWDCVDFNESTIYINKQLQKTKKVGGCYQLVSTKSGKSRLITVATSVLQVLKKQKNRQSQAQLLAGSAWSNPDNLVFTNAFGGHLVHFTVYKHFKQAVVNIGLGKTRFHDLRHSFAVASIEGGDDIKTVQSNLGHATAAFTLDVYAHTTQKMKQQSANRMEAFIQSVSTSKGSK
ncbi:MAG: tyrosine-type recombinase/integrase, partial [Oscillospiraceae bacterium]